MLTLDRHKLLRLACPAAVLAFVFVVLGPLALRAQADETDLFKYLVGLSEKEKMLADPNAATIQYLQTDTTFQRLVSRSTPFLQVKNDGSEDSIVELRLTIGDDSYHFGNTFLDAFAVVGKTTPGIAITPSVEQDGDVLVVGFDEGLHAGDFVRFRIDLDDDAGKILYPDYRTVFFGSATQAMVQVKYEGMPEPTDWVPFEHMDQESATVGSSGSCCCSFGGSDPLYRFTASGVISAVPEPGSIVLCVVGVLGGIGVHRRYRARAARGSC
jgi:hypothetical protein